MADLQLTSSAKATGLYDTASVEALSSVVTVTLINGLTLTYAVDKTVWTGSGVLNYTLTVDNTAEHDFEDPVIETVAFDSAVTIVTDSVEVDGTPTVYTFTGGVLSVTIPTVTMTNSSVITFQMQKA